MKFFFLFVFLLSSPLISLQAQENLTWAEWFNPPVFINEGNLEGQGFSDKIQKHIFKKLPQYKHEIVQANIARVISMAQNKINTCNSSWLDTPEWRKIFYFSKPYILVPTNGIIIRKKNRNKVTNSGKVSLESIIKNKSLTLGLSRLYGEGIDNILYKYKYQQNPKVTVVSKSIQPHLMLMSDRVDYILGYPFEIEFYRKTLPYYDGQYLFTTENTDTVPVVMACPRTPQGKKVINEINKILESPGIHEIYQGFLHEWLSKPTIDGMKSDYAKFVKNHYGKN